MNFEDAANSIPEELQSTPWIQNLIAVLQQQAEEIATLKEIVQEQRDEINRLKKMPKRPKFRPGGGDPKNRSGKPINNNDKGKSSSNNGIAPKKTKEEIKVPASNVPEGSRFKG